MIGKGRRAGQNAFSANRSMTTESLPPENNRAGRRNSPNPPPNPPQVPDLATTDDQLATRIAEESGHALIELRGHMGLDDARALGREGDRLSNELIMATLRDARPGDAVLSEE